MPSPETLATSLPSKLDTLIAEGIVTLSYKLADDAGEIPAGRASHAVDDLYDAYLRTRKREAKKCVMCGQTIGESGNGTD